MFLAAWDGVTPGTVLSQNTEHRARPAGPAARRRHHHVRHRLRTFAATTLSGALAAGLGLGALAVVVLFLWITSPYPDSGPNGALHVAAGLWLLGHGADLVRTDAGGAVPAPVGLTPLLLTALPVWLLNRSGAHAVERADAGEGGDAGEGDDGGHASTSAPGKRSSERSSGTGTPPVSEPTAVLGLVTGYCAVAVAVVVYTADGAIRTRPDAALAVVPLIALLAAGSGVWPRRGRPGDPSGPGKLSSQPQSRPSRADPRPSQPESGSARPAPRPSRSAGFLPDRLRTALPRGGGAVALRAAAVGAVTLVAGGALITTAALVRNAPAAHDSFMGLTEAASGRFAVLLLCGALLPNAAVWGAAYALTPGFALGTGTVVAPAGARYAALPDFPLFAALPDAGAGGPLGRAALLVPVVAAVATASTVVRGARRTGHGEGWTPAGTAGVAAAAAFGAGVLMAALAALASGPVGSGRLAEFGPGWVATGAATLCWTAVIAVPGALAARWWRVRDRSGGRKAGRRALVGLANAAGLAGAALRTTARAAPVDPADGSRPSVSTEPGGTGLPARPGPAAGRNRWWRSFPARAVARVRTPWGRKPVPGGTNVPAPSGRRSAAPGEAPVPVLPFAELPAAFEEFGPWAGSLAREERWTMLKEATGGLMTSFPVAPAPAGTAEDPARTRRGPGPGDDLGRSAGLTADDHHESGAAGKPGPAPGPGVGNIPGSVPGGAPDGGPGPEGGHGPEGGAETSANETPAP